MPLVGIGACVSLQFAFLQAGKRFFSFVPLPLPLLPR